MLYERLIQSSQGLWDSYTNHSSIKALTSSSVIRDRVDYYLKQNYLFYINYVKCIKYFEKHNNINFPIHCLNYEINLDNIKENSITTNYVNYLYKNLVCNSEIEILLTLSIHVIGHNIICKNFTELSKNSNFQNWVNFYSSDECTKNVNKLITLINQYEVSEQQFEQLCNIFNTVCQFEIDLLNQTITTNKPQVLTVAGSDSSGGAGIQADIKAISANGGYAASVITAITAQNTRGVNKIENLDNDVIEAQLKAVLEDLNIRAIKIGMLSSSQIIDTVSKNLTTKIPIVLDPVMVAKDKSVLLQKEAINDIVTKLFNKAFLITPNIEEVNQILNINIKDEKDMEVACKKLYDLGAKNILIKGGHLTSNKLVDVLYYNSKFYKYYQERITTIHTHGTGCSLSSAIATNIAKGQELPTAVENAIKYVYHGILFNYEIGNGKSPINHFHKI